MADLIELHSDDVLLYKTNTPKDPDTLAFARVLHDMFGCTVLLIDRREEIQTIRRVIGRTTAQQARMKASAPVTTIGT